MDEIILTIIRQGWPMTTSEVLHELALQTRLKLLPPGVEPPATVAALSPIVNELHRRGRLEKVDGGWKWLAPQAEPEVFMGVVQ